MTKFNTVGASHVTLERNVSVVQEPNTVTYEGAPSFKLDYQIELYQTVVTTLFGEGKFYESGNDRGDRITRLIKKCVENGHSEFVAKLAVYTRENMYLRSVPVFLVVTLAKALRDLEQSDFKHVRRLTARVIQRADELREMFAAAEGVFGDPEDNKIFKKVMPTALKRGIGDAFSKFDAYQFKKYSGGKGHIKFTDVMRVVHPAPKTKEQSNLYKMIMEDTLPNIDTWESEASILGQQEFEDEEAKKTAFKNMWQNHANNPKQGYMAKLRNLRNYVEHNIDMDNVISHLTNPKAIANSKQLPFRYFTAYRELGGKTLDRRHYWDYLNIEEDTKLMAPAEVLSALEDAFDVSLSNLPDLGDDVLVVVDQSGSMTSRLSEKGTVTCAEIAGVFGAAIWYNQVVNLGKKAMVAGFASRGKIYNWSKRTSSLSAAKEMMNTELGGATNIESAWMAAKNAGLKPTTIVVLSDLQMTGTTGNYYGRFQEIMNPEDYGLADSNTFKLSVNLQGYDNTPFVINNGWYQIGGWSEKVFDLVRGMKDKDAAIELINNEIDI